MQLEILQENLNSALTTLSRVIASKPQVPILSNILFVAVDGKLTLTASNLETSIVIETGAKIVKDGEFTVPGRILAEIISSLSAEKVLLDVQGGSLNIKSGSFSARVNGVLAAEFPKPSLDAFIKEDNTWEIDGTELQNALGATTFASASDEGRAALTGVLFKPKETGFTLAATDGFRLSVVNLDKSSLGKKGSLDSIIIPSRSLAELARVLSEKKGEKDGNSIKIYLSSKENQILFDLKEIKIISRLIAGNFPDYEKIIPTQSTLKIVTTTEELAKAVRLAAIFARDSANIVKFKIASSKMSVSANAAQVGENESQIDVTVEGKDKSEDFSIAFNFHYLLDLLAVISGEATLEFSGPVSPGIFRSSSFPNLLHIIMPVRVQD